MKRRIVKQGNRSFTVTLPVDWVREQGLGEKDEIEVVSSGDFLVLGNQASTKKRTISLRLAGRHEQSIRKLLAALYRSGYDEITLTFENKDTITSPHHFIWEELVGYEIVQRDACSYIIKDIADLDPESFDVLFKECFLSLINFKNEIQQTITEQNQEKLQQTIFHDVEINKLTNLCQRLLNKKMNDRRKIAIFATVLRGMEYLGDELKDMANFFVKHPVTLTPAAQEMLASVGQCLNEIYFLYYNFNLDKLLTLQEKLNLLKERLDNTFPHEKISSFLNFIIKKMKLLLEGPLVLKINPEEHLRKEDWVA